MNNDDDLKINLKEFHQEYVLLRSFKSKLQFSIVANSFIITEPIKELREPLADICARYGIERNFQTLLDNGYFLPQSGCNEKGKRLYSNEISYVYPLFADLEVTPIQNEDSFWFFLILKIRVLDRWAFRKIKPFLNYQQSQFFPDGMIDQLSSALNNYKYVLDGCLGDTISEIKDWISSQKTKRKKKDGDSLEGPKSLTDIMSRPKQFEKEVCEKLTKNEYQNKNQFASRKLKFPVTNNIEYDYYWQVDFQLLAALHQHLLERYYILRDYKELDASILRDLYCDFFNYPKKGHSSFESKKRENIYKKQQNIFSFIS